jgi:hypothetical protein
MAKRQYFFISLAVISLFLLCIAPVLAQQAPFSFTVSPASAAGKPGDSITYYITVNGNPGFTAPIDFTMDVKSLGYSQSMNLGECPGPYPKSFPYVLTIPENVPPGVSADVTINGRSGQSLYQQTTKLQIKGQGGAVEDLISTITQLINDAIRQISSLTGGK